MRPFFLTLAALLVVLAAAGAAVAKPPPKFAADCLHPSVKPKAIVLACGDGTASFAVARWSSWTKKSATAVGTASIDDCNPSCVAGHTSDYLARVVLDKPKLCHGALRYTRLRLTYATPPTRGQPKATLYPCR